MKIILLVLALGLFAFIGAKAEGGDPKRGIKFATGFFTTEEYPEFVHARVVIKLCRVKGDTFKGRFRVFAKYPGYTKTVGKGVIQFKGKKMRMVATDSDGNIYRGRITEITDSRGRSITLNKADNTSRITIKIRDSAGDTGTMKFGY